MGGLFILVLFLWRIYNIIYGSYMFTFVLFYIFWQFFGLREVDASFRLEAYALLTKRNASVSSSTFLNIVQVIHFFVS